MTQTVSCTCTGQPRFCGRLSSKTEADDMYVLVHNVCVLGCKEPDDMDRVSWPRMNVQNSSSLSLPYLYLHPFLNFSGMMHPFTSHDLAHTPHSASDILPSPRNSLSAVRQSYASVELFFLLPAPAFSSSAALSFIMISIIAVLSLAGATSAQIVNGMSYVPAPTVYGLVSSAPASQVTGAPSG